MKYLIALITAATLPVFGAESTNAAVKAELDSVPEARRSVSAAQIAQRLRRQGDGWVLNDQDREKLSITLTNQQGKVCAGPVVSKLAPYGLLVEHESGAFWCGWSELPLETREKYQAIAARAQKNNSPKTFGATSPPASPPVARLDPVSEKREVHAKQPITQVDPAFYIRRHAVMIPVVIDEFEYPKTENATLACKEITSELKQFHKALELGISYTRFCDLLQEKALAIQKIKDLRGDGIPPEFLWRAERCINKLSESKRDWKRGIDSTDDDGFYTHCRQKDWLESEGELFYCIGIAEKNPAMIDEIYKQEARVIQQEQVAVKLGMVALSDLPLLPPMSQEDIVARLKAATQSTRPKSK